MRANNYSNNYKSSSRILAKDVTITNDTRTSGLNNNDCIIGGSGSGKTGGYLVPNLIRPSGSMVVSDTKGLLYQKYANHLRNLGYNVKVIDLVNPEQSIGYNPLSYIRKERNGNYKESDIKKIATILMPKLDAREPFWEKAAIRYISMLISYVLEALPKNEHNMKSVSTLHTEYQYGPGKELFSQWAIENPNSIATRKYRTMSQNAVAEKMWASIMEFANEGLDTFAYADYDSVFNSEDSFELKTLGREKTVLFINTTDHDSSMHILCDILNTQLFQILIDEADSQPSGRLAVPVKIYMDDFGATSPIPDFDQLISIIRSRDLSVSIILQSLTQLYSHYSYAEAHTILNNCDHILYLGGGHDIATAQFISEHVNKTPSTVLAKPKEKAYLITSGSTGMLVDKIAPYSYKPKTKKETTITKAITKANEESITNTY